MITKTNLTVQIRFFLRIAILLLVSHVQTTSYTSGPLGSPTQWLYALDSS